jgi:putative aldouronate transport system permease protein
MARRIHIRVTIGDRIFDLINMIFLTFSLLVVFLPLLNIVSQSISDPASVLAGKVIFLPVKPTLTSYGRILNNTVILSGFMNSALITILGTLLSVSLTIMAAYPLARNTLVGRNAIMWYFVFTMLFNGGLIPTYLVVRGFGMIDKYTALIIPNAISVWNIVIARTFFINTIPNELYEAATIDGSSDIRTFIQIALPVSKPILAVMTLFYAVGIWNSYFDAMIYLKSQQKYPLQLVLRNILISSQLQAQMIESRGGVDQSQSLAVAEALKYAVIIFSSLPLLILYPFIQKYFVKGIMIGAIKG